MKMKRSKKILSTLLVLIVAISMCIGMIGVSAYADNDNNGVNKDKFHIVDKNNTVNKDNASEYTVEVTMSDGACFTATAADFTGNHWTVNTNQP